MNLSFDLTLPVGHETAQTRTLGDPGLTEFFERPHYMYLFLAVGEPTTPSANDVYFYSLPTQQSDWTRTDDSLAFHGHFTQVVNWNPDLTLESLRNGKLRAYIVASFDALTTNPNGITYNDYHQVTTTSVDKESELLNLQFYAYAGSSDYSKVSLRDVYSTPYNLEKGAVTGKLTSPDTDRSDYYGTVSDVSIVGTGVNGSITISDTLYHTAAKVDFQWNTAQRGQSNVMQSVVLTNCPKVGYLFRLAEQVGATAEYSKVLLGNSNVSLNPSVGIGNDQNDQHTAHYADADEVDAGNQWSGRAYTYILQPGDISYTLTTTVGGSHELTDAEPEGNGTTNDIFAAWYKLNFNINAK